MYDAALYYGERSEHASKILERLGLDQGGYVLATIHRAENTDDPSRLRTIVEGLAAVGRSRPVVLPLHPRTQGVLERAGLLSLATSSLRACPPVGYLDMTALERHAAVIVTDSGGVQKEAYFHRVPCVTLRTETEWVELVDGGWNVLCPPEEAEIIERTVLKRIGSHGASIDPYGAGDAANRIVQRLLAEHRR
jgi:UDP-GlcNAc3NAcA epimerase